MPSCLYVHPSSEIGNRHVNIARQHRKAHICTYWHAVAVINMWVESNECTKLGGKADNWRIVSTGNASPSRESFICSTRQAVVI